MGRIRLSIGNSATILSYVEQFERSANVDDIVFSVVVTDNRRLFDEDVRNAGLMSASGRRSRAAGGDDFAAVVGGAAESDKIAHQVSL